MASENSGYRKNFAELSNVSSPEFHIPHYPWGEWNRSITLMLKMFIAVNGKSWNSSPHWRLWLVVEKKHLPWGKGWRRTVLGNQPRADKGISIDILMQKIARTASQCWFGQHKQSKGTKAKQQRQFVGRWGRTGKLMALGRAALCWSTAHLVGPLS